jgi:LPS sulfotransferase NodH
VGDKRKRVGSLRLVLAAHARSGSNSLVEILNLAPDVSMLNEPFNENFTRWSPENPNYRDRVVDTTSLDAVMNEIFASWTGIKTLGYQLDLCLLEHLVLRPDVHVVFLRRRNLLETVVSNLIALQTNLWKTWDATGPIEDRYRALDALPIEDVRVMLRWTRERLDETEAILDQRTDGRAFKVVYEDLYLATSSSQHALLRQLWAFLDLTPPTDERLNYYLDPASVQMAAAATYGRLPNAAAINDACGSDEAGWLTYL